MEHQKVSGKPELIRRINRTLLLDLLRREGPLSRSDLALRSGMSLPAVSKAVAELLADGAVREIGAGTSSGGRRPILLEFNPRSGFIVAVDVTPYRLLGAVSDLAGELVQTECETPHALGLPLLDQVADLVQRLVDQVRSMGGSLTGIGVAVPGIPDLKKATVRFAPALEWEGVPAGQVLRERFPCPVVIQNDVDSLLLGERWLGAAAGVRHAVAVIIGSGVGAGVLVDGHLYRGRDGAVGEIGYWMTDPDQKGSPRAAGQLESHVSLAPLAHRWAERVGLRLASDADLVSAMVQQALSGEPAAREIVMEAARMAGMVICNLITLLNPDVVIFGGAALQLESLILPEINALVARQTLYPVPVTAARLGEHSALIGCVVGVLEQQRSSVSYVE